MTAYRLRAVLFFLAMSALVFAVGEFQTRGAAQSDRPGFIPTQADGYSISQTDGPEAKAPSGFEGRTFTSMRTALGNTPATRGKSVIARFKLSNKIRTCPDGDGVSEGDGEFSITVDSKDANTNLADHFEMLARAKYKGKVNDDAWLEGPVKAEIDFTQSGGNFQHVTIPFVVGPGLSIPTFGPFSGGDPSHGRVSDAYDVGMGLAYWGGIYYSEAQHQWRDGLCAEASFDPPSRTRQPAPGTQVKVKAHVKSKRGEIVKAHFQEVHVLGSGSVTPADDWSTDKVPLTFTYTAGNAPRGSPAGFAAIATSRAGIAKNADWNATLGSDWTGQIECSHIVEPESKSSEQQTASGSTATRYTVDVQPGASWARGYHDARSFGQNLRGVVRNGHSSWEFDNSYSMNGIAQDEKAATVNVELDLVKGTYRISVGHTPFALGQAQSVSCNHSTGCIEQSLTFGVESCMPPGAGLYGTFTNPNELSGSLDQVQAGLGALRNGGGKETWSITWHLSRQGTTR